MNVFFSLSLMEKLKMLAFIITFPLLVVAGSRGQPSGCPGLERLSRTLSNPPGPLTRNINLTCKILKGCTGMQCSGKINNHAVFLKLTMNHCTPPFKIELVFKSHDLGLDFEKELVDGKEMKLMELPSLSIPVFLTPHIKRVGDNLTLQIDICARLLTRCVNSLPLSATFNVKRELCAGNPPTRPALPRISTHKVVTLASTAAFKPSTKHPGGKPRKPTTTLVTTVKTVPTKRTKLTTPKIAHSTGKPTEAKRKSGKPKSSLHPHHSRQPKVNPVPQSHGDGNSGGLSTGGKVAIVASAGLIFIVIIGVAFYWRRLKSRRPAFYNDIAINDPLRGDMYDGDEEPLFDSHLVL